MDHPARDRRGPRGGHDDRRSRVALRGDDPHDPPRIRYNFFSAPNDLPGLVHGFKLAREMVHQPALDSYRGRELNPGDKVSKVYVERCEYFMANPPDADWDGTWIMESK